MLDFGNVEEEKREGWREEVGNGGWEEKQPQFILTFRSAQDIYILLNNVQFWPNGNVLFCYIMILLKILYIHTNSTLCI